MSLPKALFPPTSSPPHQAVWHFADDDSQIGRPGFARAVEATGVEATADDLGRLWETLTKGRRDAVDVESLLQALGASTARPGTLTSTQTQPRTTSARRLDRYVFVSVGKIVTPTHPPPPPPLPPPPHRHLAALLAVHVCRWTMPPSTRTPS